MDTSALDFRQNLRILLMFLIVQFTALFFATYIYSGASLLQQSAQQYSQSVNSAFTYIIIIALFAFVVIMIIRYNKSDKIFIALEAIAVIGSSFFLFLILVGILTNSLAQVLYSTTITYQYIVAIILAIALLVAKNKWPRLRNTVSIIASVGIGLVIGISLDFIVVMIFMALLAIYDFIAVFITKHMVTMGTAMARMNLAFLVGTSEAGAIPATQMSRDERKQAAMFRPAFQEHKGVLKDLDKQKMVPVITPRLLGNGDLATPAMVAVAAFKVMGGFGLSIAIVIGASCGLMLTFYILNRYRKPLPAIPPLLLGVVFGIIVYSLATGILVL